MARAALLILLSTLLGACAPTEPTLTPTQWEAVEVRTIDVPAARAFTLVAQTMLDQGYVVLVSDSAAGLIRGARVAAPAYQAQGQAPEYGALWPGEVVAYVRAEGPARSRVRLQLRENGVRIAESDRVRDWSAAIEKRSLEAGRPLAAPARAGGSP